jgi:hypothetical protein
LGKPSYHLLGKLKVDLNEHDYLVFILGYYAGWSDGISKDSE